MASIRTFVGIALSPACRDIMGTLGPRLRALARRPVTVTRPENAHLTLRFLGDVPEADIPAVQTALAGVAFAPFAVQPAGGGFFPGPDRPRVIWAGLAEGAAPCRAVAAAVDAALAPLGFAPQSRPFASHLTLGRVKVPGRDGDWPGILSLLARTSWPPFPVTAFCLYRSTLSAAGSRYDVLAAFPAGGEADDTPGSAA